MRFIILAFNPNHINQNDLLEMVELIEKDWRCKVYWIAHIQKDAEPIYCVQFADTKEELNYGPK